MALAHAHSLSAQSVERHEFSEAHMGTTFRIVVHASDRLTAERAVAGAFRVVGRLDSLFSDYRADSEISRLSTDAVQEPRSVSPELWRVLSIATRWSARTDGAFDVTVGPLSRLWRWSSRRGVLPDPDRLADALRRVGFELLTLDARERTILLERPGMALDLGGIAKGFAADAALAELVRLGLPSALVDAGGDLALGAAPPGRDGWRVVTPQNVVLRLADVAVATSGAQHRYIEVAGVRYSHLVDPRTGLGVPDAPTVTVVAPDATTADVLASALSVMDEAAGAALLRSLDGVSASATGATEWSSEDFPRPEPGTPRGENR